jgi:hypothetical protein
VGGGRILGRCVVIVSCWITAPPNGLTIGEMSMKMKNIRIWKSGISLMIGLMITYLSKGSGLDPEKLWVHFDRPFYLTGETIWYKVYNANFHEHTEHSKVVYVNVHNKEGKMLAQQKHELLQGNCSGSYDIPISWSEDYYYITCFTKWNLQFADDAVFTKRIAIYSPFESNQNAGSSEVITISPTGNYRSDETNQSINIQLNKNEYTRREKVFITLKSDTNSNCSISVITKDEFEIGRSFSSNSTIEAKYDLQSDVVKEKQLTIEGMVKDISTKNMVWGDVFSLYKTGSKQFYRISSKDGSIQNDIEPYFGKATFQLFNMNPFEPGMVFLELNINGFKLNVIDQQITRPERNEEIDNYIHNARLRKKFAELFANNTIDSLGTRIFIPTGLVADKTYQMEKYKSLKTLEEFFREIVILTEVSKADGKPTVRLKNTDTQRFFMEKPWYLVDGYLTRDEEKVLNIPFKNLKSVEIFNTNASILNQLESVMIRSGLIAISTNDLYLRSQIEKEPNIIEIRGFEPLKDFAFVATTSLGEAREKPNFNHPLYWNPNISLERETSLEFVTSDLLGEFVILIYGFSEGGNRVFGIKKFSVDN